MESSCEIVADLAAQASGLQLDHAFFASLDQVMIEADLAELVDDYGGSRKLWLKEQVTQERCLAAPEKAGENQSLDHIGTSG